MDDSFELEVMKLLLQVVWADGEVSSAETAVFIDYAMRLDLPRTQISALVDHLEGKGDLPPVDIHLLKREKEAVLAAARRIVSSDDEIALDEQLIVGQIERLLE